MIVQPTLFVPPEIRAGLLDGSLTISGSIVRWAATGRIRNHLQPIELPTPEATQAAVNRMPSGTRTQYALAIAAGGAVLVGGAYALNCVLKKRAGASGLAAEDMPECVISFEASLRSYVKAGQTGTLNAEIVERLIGDLDAVKEFMEEGNTVLISLDKLVPLFDLVIAHTPRLAVAYNVDLKNLNGQDDDAGGVVVNLRRHLEVQKSILDGAA